MFCAPSEVFRDPDEAVSAVRQSNMLNRIGNNCFFGYPEFEVYPHKVNSVQ
jgi:hypothetical protein